jgi:hypothetical protein
MRSCSAFINLPIAKSEARSTNGLFGFPQVVGAKLDEKNGLTRFLWRAAQQVARRE